MPSEIGFIKPAPMPASATPGALALGADVPASNLCVAVFSGSDDAGVTLSGLSSNFTGAWSRVNHGGFSGLGVQFAVAQVTSTGSGKTITPVWSSGLVYGPTCTLLFFNVSDPAACIAELNAEGTRLQLDNSGDTTPLTLGITAGSTSDLVYMYDARYTTSGAIPPEASGYTTIITEADLRGTTARLARKNSVAVGTNSATTQDTNYSGLIVFVIRDIGGAAAVLSLPTGAATGPNSSSGSVSTNTGSGTLYWVTTTSATPPSAGTIKAGSSQAVTGTGVQNVTSGGLSPSTTYYNHFIQVSGGLDSNIVSSSGFTTPSAGTPPTVAITSQVVAGQSLTLSGTYTGTPTSATATVPAAAVPNGAVTQGPSAVTYGSGTWSITFTGLSPGDYDPPTVTMANGSGSDDDAGSAFTVMEIDGEPEAPNPGTMEETVTPVDSVSGTQERIGATLETVTAADSQNRTTVISRPVAETLASTDSQNRTVTATAAAAETVAPADTQTGTPGITRATPETVAPADTQNRSLAATGANTEVVAPADATNASSVLGNAVADTLAPSDSQGLSAGIQRGTQDALAAAETVGATLGTQGSVSESLAPADSISGLVVMGTAMLESLSSLGEQMDGVVSSIVGVIGELVVLNEQQFQSLIVAGGVVEFADAADTVDSAPIITALTVVEQVNAADLVARLRYPKPPGPGNNKTRRFIVYYK